MLLRTWRKEQDYTLSEAEEETGVNRAVFSEAERGVTLPKPETIARLEGATGGLVTAADHYAAWRRSHFQTWKRMAALGRHASKSHEKDKHHGRKASKE